MKLFIIEDEVPIRQELTQFLEKYGFQCESSDDFHGIAQLALASGADLLSGMPGNPAKLKRSDYCAYQ